MLRADLGQHTLTCGACGAPLRQLKMLPMAVPAAQPAISHQPRPAKPAYAKPVYEKKVRKPKKRKGLFRRFAEEAFDLVEDIFD